MIREYFKTYELAEMPEICPKKSPEKIKPYFGLDDILIAALLFVMITEDEPDYISIIALAFLFFT